MTKTARKIFATIALTGLVVGLAGGVASAHVVVKPAEVATAAFQTFTTSVPNELESPTVKVRVVIPDSVKHVSPTVKPGWTISEVKDGEGESAVVKEITWQGGEIPAGQRDDFSFSAQAPATATTLQWKAYQTYGDGTEVAWDKAPVTSKAKAGDDDESTKPYSETKVVDNLTKAPASAPKSDGAVSLAFPLAVVALVFSIMALTRSPKASSKASATETETKADKTTKKHKN